MSTSRAAKLISAHVISATSSPNRLARAKHIADGGSKREMLKKAARYQAVGRFRGTTAHVNRRTDGEGPGTCPSDLDS
jgi:hypothetical protein